MYTGVLKVFPQAEIGLKNFGECISDCKKVLQLDQENRDAKLLLRQAVSGQKEADKKSKAVFASSLAEPTFPNTVLRTEKKL